MIYGIWLWIHWNFKECFRSFFLEGKGEVSPLCKWSYVLNLTQLWLFDSPIVDETSQDFQDFFRGEKSSNLTYASSWGGSTT